MDRRTELSFVATLLLCLPITACAQAPGGRTVGGGVASTTVIAAGATKVIFDCGGTSGVSCTIDLCVTVRNDGPGTMSVTLAEPTSRDGTPVTVSRKQVEAEAVKTVCNPGIARVVVRCEAGATGAERRDCEYAWRIDNAPITERP